MEALYQFTVPMFVKQLGALRNILDKVAAHAQEQHVDEITILQDKLAPDMFTFTRQVQIACDNAKGATARLAGVEVPKHEDTETTVAQLQSRIDKTLEFVKSVPESAFADAATRQVTLAFLPGKYMTGYDYAREYAIPNFLFHVVTAYALARRNGVQIGKADFMNGLPLKDL
ncbi:MAG: DUF1993 domain-containing protein [Patescibacteria group bacterium]